MRYVTEVGMKRTQDGGREGDKERGFGSDRKENVKFGEMAGKCQGLWLWRTCRHDSSYHHPLL